MKKRHVQVRKKYKSVDGRVVEKVRGTRRVKAKRKDSKGNTIYVSTDESYTEGEVEIDDPEKLKNVQGKLKSKVKEENKKKKESLGLTEISAKINRKYKNGLRHDMSDGDLMVDPDDFTRAG